MNNYAMITGLERGRLYGVRMRAKNSKGIAAQRMPSMFARRVTRDSRFPI